MPLSFRSFDNRQEPLRHDASFKLQPRTSLKRRLTTRLPPRSPLLFERGAPHFTFEIAEETFIYAYLRKNGCTSFKTFLLEEYNIEYKDELDKINQITLQCGVTKQNYDENAKTLLILRDPIVRICSLFRNKFIESPQSSYLPQRYATLAAQDPDRITFRQFVQSYLFPCLRDQHNDLLDPHCLPQAVQMWPIHYSNIFLLEDLGKAAHQLFGIDVATRYFAQKVNASSDRFIDDEAAETPAVELRRIFAEQARTPSDAALLGTDLEAALRDLYAVDYALMDITGLPVRPAALA